MIKTFRQIYFCFIRESRHIYPLSYFAVSLQHYFILSRRRYKALICEPSLLLFYSPSPVFVFLKQSPQPKLGFKSLQLKRILNLRSFCIQFLLLGLQVLGMELRASHMPIQYYQLHIKPNTQFFLLVIRDTVKHKKRINHLLLMRWGWKQASCLHFINYTFLCFYVKMPNS